ncbi:MAG: WG repeat-containing protein [Saprospiraceae bacterium]|nr:WG repeat-containing protein [Saprospiraceae bacterium]
MKEILSILFLFLITPRLSSQNMYSYSSGNGYGFEIAVAEQALDCIAKGCFGGLKRTMFIDENTESDENEIIQIIDSINSKSNYGHISHNGFHYNANIPSLTFYKTFYHKTEDSIVFQIKLELIYKSGLLAAKSVKYIDKEFEFSKIEKNQYENQKDNGSKTNIPPPPITSYDQDIIYKVRGLNLCSDCTQKKLITIDQSRNFWLNEKYKYDLIQQMDDDIFRVKKNGLWGVVNHENEELIPVIYNNIEIWDHNYVKVFKEGKVGIYYKNKVLFPVEYEELTRYFIYKNDKHSCLFIAKKDNLYGVFDDKGAIVISIEHQEVTLFYSKYFKIKNNGLYGVVKTNGDVLYKTIYKEINFEPFIFHGIMKVTNKKGNRKVLVLIEEKGITVIKKVKDK